jgi:alkylation response protein AidB-like acyl-CoA dehydrogenase
MPGPSTSEITVEENPSLAEFRKGFRDWMASTLPGDWKTQLQSDLRGFNVWWVTAMRDAGYGPPHWAKGVGGPGLTLPEQLVIYEELTQSDCPNYPGLFSCAYTHVHDTLTLHGSQEQIETHLKPILDAERVWAQAFSEPEAGSDLASLRTRAVRDGDRYIVNGQKIWSTLAPNADWAILLARTDPDASKHKGISYFLVDLRSPGVEVRPIKQITGAEDDFAEIFFTDVEIPVENLVGRENEGWRIAHTTLAAERGPLAVPTALKLREALADALDLARPQVPDTDTFALSSLGQRYAQLHGEVEILAEMLYGTLARFIEVGEPGPESSIIKLFLAPLMQRVSAFGLDVAGSPGHHESSTRRQDKASEDWLVNHLGSWVWTIAGGSDQIQRNIIGERVLGLPRDPLAN